MHPMEWNGRAFKDGELRIDSGRMVEPGFIQVIEVSATERFRPLDWEIEEGWEAFTLWSILVEGEEQLMTADIPVHHLCGVTLVMPTLDVGGVLQVSVRNVTKQPRIFKSRWRGISPA
jgi:hypothetical protein